MSYEMKTRLKDGREATLEFDGYVLQDHTQKWFPEFIEEPKLFVHENGCDYELTQENLGTEEWDRLEQSCADYLYDHKDEE